MRAYGQALESYAKGDEVKYVKLPGWWHHRQPGTTGPAGMGPRSSPVQPTFEEAVRMKRMPRSPTPGLKANMVDAEGRALY